MHRSSTCDNFLLMRERTILDNFTRSEAYNVMYNLIMDDKINYGELDASNKKLYNECRKYIIHTNYQDLKIIEEEKETIRVRMNNCNPVSQEYHEIKREYKELVKEYKDFKGKLTENDEDRKCFNLCLRLEKLDRME